ncbi:sulfotransferase 1E1-like [Mya arenaria]|uniref:sulfotransferase 1E1-like n=1 Tax=Mya arenaria TaxID=6604 RepID=UPI0022E315FF|nr:sulfotransferase 1E1-like [Mya arenaria]
MNVRFNHTSCKYHISTLKMSDKVTDKETIQVGLRKYKGTSVFSSCEVEKIPEMTIIEDDVWILTFPRSGTTLTQEIVWLLCNKVDTEAARATPLDARFPFLDINTPEFPLFRGIQSVEEQKSPRLIKTHLHRHLLPSDLFRSKCKKIYVLRNPKDAFVSCMMLVKFLQQHEASMPLEDFLDFWLSGDAYATPWWLHVRDFWAHRDDPSFLFLRYEEMVTDMKAAIRSIADHLGVEVTDDDVDKINDHCTFRSMKENESTNAIWMRDCTNVDQSFGGHVRKGKVGGWREHLTPEMSGKIDSMVHEKLGHLDINFDYGE